MKEIMNYLKSMKEWAEKDKNVLLCKLKNGGYALYGKGYSPEDSSDNSIIECQIKDCVGEGRHKIWATNKKKWVIMCSSCLNKLWPRDK